MYLRTLILFSISSYVATIVGETVSALLLNQWDREASTAAQSIAESARVRGPLAALWGALTVLLALRLLMWKRNSPPGRRHLTVLTLGAAVVPVGLGHALGVVGMLSEGLQAGSIENALLVTYLLGPMLAFSLGYWLFTSRMTSTS